MPIRNDANYPWSRRRKTITYRGLEMEVILQNREGGHRHQVHQYLGYDEPFTETFGRKANTYSFEVVVSGNDYDRDLKRHIDTFEREGRGRLTLWHGKDRFVVCRRWRISERSSSAGFAKIMVDFVDAGGRSKPGSVLDSLTQLDNLVASVKAFAITQFDKIGSIIASNGSLANSMFELGTSLKSSFDEGLAFADDSAGLASNMATSLLDFNANLQSLATNALGLGASISDLYDDLQFVGDDFNRRYDTVAALATWDDTLSPVPEVTTNTGQLRAANQDAFSTMIEIMATIHAANNAVRLEYKSSQEASERRDSLALLLDRVILKAGNANDDASYIALRDAKAIAVDNLDLKAARLPTRVDLVFDIVVPSLVTSFRLYGTNTRADEIIDANNIRHPAFVPAAVSLQVVSPIVSGSG